MDGKKQSKPLLHLSDRQRILWLIRQCTYQGTVSAFDQTIGAIRGTVSAFDQTISAIRGPVSTFG